MLRTPSHLKVTGNDQADALAEEDRAQHPYNKCRRQEEQVWAALGLSPISSEVSTSLGAESMSDARSSVRSASSSESEGFTSSSTETSSGGSFGGSEYNTDMSGWQRMRH